MAGSLNEHGSSSIMSERQGKFSGFLCINDILEWKSRDSRAFS